MKLPSFLALPSNIPSDMLQVAQAFSGLASALQNWVAQVAGILNNNAQIGSGVPGGVVTYATTLTVTSSPALGQNKLVLGGGSSGTPSTPVGLGTSVQVLHGNASGPPTWGSVQNADLANSSVTLNGHPVSLGGSLSLTLADISADPLAVAHGGTGAAAAGTALDNIGPFSTTGYLRRTGAGAYTIDTPGQLVGEPSNGNASAGNVGEYVTANLLVASEIVLTTATNANVTSISLTAGDWDVEGHVVFDMNAATPTKISGAVSSTTAAIPVDATAGGMFRMNLTGTYSDASAFDLPTGRTRFSLASTTTIFLVARAVFTGTKVAAYGIIEARRVR